MNCERSSERMRVRTRSSHVLLLYYGTIIQLCFFFLLSVLVFLFLSAGIAGNATVIVAANVVAIIMIIVFPYVLIFSHFFVFVLSFLLVFFREIFNYCIAVCIVKKNEGGNFRKKKNNNNNNIYVCNELFPWPRIYAHHFCCICIIEFISSAKRNAYDKFQRFSSTSSFFIIKFYVKKK